MWLKKFPLRTHGAPSSDYYKEIPSGCRAKRGSREYFIYPQEASWCLAPFWWLKQKAEFVMKFDHEMGIFENYFSSTFTFLFLRLKNWSWIVHSKYKKIFYKPKYTNCDWVWSKMTKITGFSLSQQTVWTHETLQCNTFVNLKFCNTKVRIHWREV